MRSSILAAEVEQLSKSGARPETRARWLSPRAMLLHLAVFIVVPGCLAAGWWQATRALAGNGLSWFYSVEWPAFAIVAVVAWWHLIHEDPEQYRARRAKPPSPPGAAVMAAGAGTAGKQLTVDRADARLATILAALVGVDSAVGVATVVAVPFSRPTGLAPHGSLGLYLLHAVVGASLVIGGAVLLVRVRQSSRLARLTGWVGATGVALAGLGGLLTVAHPVRLAGMALMLLGAATAAFGYVVPTLERIS